MNFQELSAHVSSACTPYDALGFLTAITVVMIVYVSHRRAKQLDAFPTVGSTTWLGSWWASLKYLTNAENIIRKGCDEHKSKPFKVAEPTGWWVIINDRKRLEEVAKAPDDVFSFWDISNDQLQFEHTLGPSVYYNPYHISVIRSQLTRNIEAIYPEIRDEIITSFSDILDLRGSEWKSVPALNAIQEVVCRASNRLFVGLPLCRNLDWINLNTRSTINAMKWGIIIGLFPKFMRSQVAHLLTNIVQDTRRGTTLIGPLVEERQKFPKGSKWDDKPNDLLSWLMDEAKGSELTAESLTTRLLIVNLAAIHSSSHSFTMALFYLAANPQYVQPLREEVESIIAKDGWSKSALAKMRRVDSFLKECQRIEGISIVTLARKALKDFTFADGIFIPKGTMIAAATHALHHDEAVYRNSNAFEPFRFANIHEEDGKAQQHQFASATTEYLPFGFGKHACPGRFFIANELKTMMAHIVITYDVKLEEDGVFPSSLHIGPSILANSRAKVLFRNRVD